MGKPSSERAAIRQIIRALVAAGWTLHAVDDGDYDRIGTRGENYVLDAIMAVDEARLYVERVAPSDQGWVWFVLGNDPSGLEVAADHTVNLSPVLDPLFDRWEA